MDLPIKVSGNRMNSTAFICILCMTALNSDGSTSCLCGLNNGYNPNFPASSPYVVTVGATMGYAAIYIVIAFDIKSDLYAYIHVFLHMNI